MVLRGALTVSVFSSQVLSRLVTALPFFAGIVTVGPKPTNEN
jgi:hypothetical protein